MSTRSHLDSPPFHPKNNITANIDERQQWVRQLLVDEGIWTGFAHSRDHWLSNVFRDHGGNQVEESLMGVLVGLSKLGRMDLLKPVCLCLASRQYDHCALRLLQEGQHEGFKEIFGLAPGHVHDQVLAFAVHKKLDGLVDFMWPHLDRRAFVSLPFSRALEVTNDHAGPLLLRHLDLVAMLKEFKNIPGAIGKVDRWSAQNIDQGLMVFPNLDRSTNYWVKKLPMLRSTQKAKVLDEALSPEPVPPRSRPRF